MIVRLSACKGNTIAYYTYRGTFFTSSDTNFENTLTSDFYVLLENVLSALFDQPHCNTVSIPN